MKEIWKDIPGYEGLYQVSSFGKVKSLARMKSCGKNRVRQLEEKILKTHSGSSKYLCVQLHKNGTRKNFLVHRLVAMIFIKNPNDLPQVNHKDENVFNNCIDNLEWCTNDYNQHYGTKFERMMKNKQKQMKKISQYDLQNNYIKTFNSISEAARELNGNRQNIVNCLKNKTKYAYNYKWKYERR